MATHPGPRPKRKEYLTKIGFEIALSSWQTMVDLYNRDKEQERLQRQAQRTPRTPREAPHRNVGGGGPCDTCKGTKVCRGCRGSTWFTRGDGVQVRCKRCEPSGPRASESDRGQCRTCHGTGVNPPTRYHPQRITIKLEY